MNANGSLESVSRDYGSESGFKLTDAVITGIDLDIVEQYTTLKAYDENKVLRVDSTSDLESLSLVVASVTVNANGSLESVSRDYGSESGFKLTDAVITGIDLDIVEQYTTLKAYDENKVLRVDSTSDLESLSLVVASVTVNANGSLESVSRDYGSESGFKLTDAVITGIDLDIVEQYTTLKAYDENKVLRVDSTSDLESLSLVVASVTVNANGSLESVSRDHGSESGFKLTDAVITGIDLDIVEQYTTLKAYDENKVLRVDSTSDLESLSLVVASVTVNANGSLESVSRDHGSESGFKLTDAVITGIDLDIVEQYTTLKAYDENKVLRVDSTSDLESLSLVVASVTVNANGSLESVSRDYGSESGFKLTDAVITGIDLDIVEQYTTLKAYDENKVLRVDSTSDLESLSLVVASVTVNENGSLESVSRDHGSESGFKLTDAVITGIDLDIIEQYTTLKAYDGNAVLRVDSTSDLESLSLVVASVTVNENGSLESVSRDHGSESGFKLTDAVITGIDLDITEQYTTLKAYDGNAVLRVDSTSDLESLSLVVASVTVNENGSLESVSRDHGSESGFKLTDAVITGIDLDITEQYTTLKAYDGNAVLRVDSTSDLESLSLVVASVTVNANGSLESVSRDHGSESGFKLTDAVITGIDLDITEQYTTLKAYDGNAVLRVDSTSDLESLSLVVANVTVNANGSLESVSRDHGSESGFKLTDAVITGIDLDIIEQYTTLKAYDGNAVLRVDSTSDLESLSLVVASVTVNANGSLESVSRDHGSESGFKLTDAVITGIDLDITEQYTTLKAYDGNAVLRVDSTSDLESLSLVVASVTVNANGSLESVSRDHGSESGFKLTDAVITGIDLDITEQYTTLKAYDGNAVLRVDSTSDLESLSLVVASVTVNANGSLESVSRDHGSESGFKLTDAVITGIDLDITEQYTTLKAYDGNAVLRVDSTSDLESLSLVVASVTVNENGSLESVSRDHGSESGFKLTDAVITGIDLDITEQYTTLKAYDGNAVLRVDSTSDLESLSLVVANVTVNANGSLESVSRDHGSESGFKLTDAVITGIDLDIIEQYTTLKAYDGNAVLRVDSTSDLESLSLVVASVTVNANGSLESVSRDHGSESGFKLTDAVITGIDLDIVEQYTTLKAYDGNAVLRVDSTSDLESLSLVVASVTVNENGSLESVSRDHGSESGFKLTDAVITGIDLDIVEQYTTLKAYDGNAVLRVDSTSDLESLSLVVANVTVNANGSLESVSRDHGSESGFKLTDAVITGIDLDIIEQYTTLKAYDGNAVLRVDSTSDLESLSLVVANVTVNANGSLESVSRDHGSESGFKLTDAVITGIDLDIVEQYTTLKAYDGNAVLRVDSTSDLESLSLVVANVTVNANGSLESVSRDHGSESGFKLTDAVITGIDLDIVEQYTTLKAYDGNAVLRVDSTSDLESLSLVVANVTVNANGSLESVSRDHGSESGFKLTDAVITGIDLDIVEQYTTLKAYDGNAVLRVDSTSDLESLSLVVANVTVNANGSLESVSRDHGSESGFKLTDAVITGIDLDIIEQYTTLKAYDGNAVLRVDSTSDLESLSLVVANVTVNENGSLESVSRDHGSESGFKLTDAVITGIDLDIIEQYTTLKAYDGNAVLRVDSTSDLESLSLVVANVTVNENGSLESVSRDHGSESGFKLTDAVITGIDLDIIEQYTTLKAYDGNAVLRVDSTSDLESLSLVVASVTVNANGSLESVSRDHGSESGFKLTDAVITGIDLDIVEQYTTLKAYDGNAVLRVDSTSDLESLSLVVASVTVNANGSLESVSRDHGSESGFKLTDAVITGIDLDIIEQYTTLKAYDGNAVLRVDSTSDLESLSLVVANVTVNANGSLESVSRDHGSESGFKLTDAVITGIDLDIVEQYTTLKAYDGNAVLRVDSTSDLESLSLVVANVTVNANGSLESVSRDHGSESGFKLTDAVITGIDLDIIEQYTTLKAYDGNAVLRVDSTSDLESLSLVVANVTVNANGSLESVSRDHGSESGFKLTDAVITGIDLDIVEQYTTLKAYDENKVLRVDSTSDLESLSLVVANVTVNANGSLESVSRDHGSESGFKLTDAVITGIDLDIVEQYTTLKAYDGNAVLRVDSTSDLESLSLVVANVTVNANGSLESVSRDHGSESGFKLTDAVITGIDLDIIEQYTTLKAYDGNAVLRVDSTSDLESLSLVVANVTVNANGSLESVSRDHGSESGFKLTDAVITGIDLDIIEQYTTLKAYDGNAVLRVDSTSDLESLSLVVANVTVNANGSLESVSRDHGSESGFKLTDAVITGIDLDIIEQYTTLKAYDGNAVLRVDSTSDLESLSLVVANVTVNANGSLESVSRDHGSESGFKLTDAVITGIDLDIIEQYTTLKAYDGNAVLRVDSTSDLESLSLVVANVTVNANGSLESVSRDHGSESGFKLTDAVITGIDLDIIEQYTTLKAYDGNAVLRVDSTSDLESLSLVVANVTVNANGSLESVSRDHGSESGFKLTDAVITGIDLDIIEQYTTLKAYDGNAVLRVDSTSDLESLSLVVANVTVNANGSLESVSRDHGSESGFKLTDAVITGIDLDIIEQYTTLKAYDGNAVLRVDSTSDLESLSLVVANVTVNANGSLESVSRDHGSESGFKLTDAVITGIDLDIIEQYTTLKAYDGNAVLRVDSTSDLESLSLVVANVTVNANGSLESVSRDHGSESGFKLTDAVITGIDLDIIEQYTTLKAYDGNAVLRVDSTSDLESLSLVVANVTVNANGSLESVSRDHGSESGFKLTDAVITGIDLDIIEQYTTLKAYDGNAVLRVDSTSDLESLSLVVANVTVNANGSLESVSRDHGSESGFKLTDAVITGIDLDIIEQYTTLKAYDGNAVLRVDSTSDLESLSLVVANVTVNANGSLESVSRDHGSESGFKLTDAVITGIDLDIIEQYTTLKAYDGNAVLRVDSTSDLESLSLVVANVTVNANGSLESVSRDHGSESGFKLTDAVITGIDLDIIEQYTTLKAYDGNAVLRVDSTSDLESLSLVVANVTVNANGSLESVSRDHGSESGFKLTDAVITGIDLDIVEQYTTLKAYDGNAVLRVDSTSDLESLSLVVANVTVNANGSLESVSRDHGSESGFKLTDAVITGIDLDIIEQYTTLKAYDGNAVLRVDSTSDLESLSLVVASVTVNENGSLESVSRDHGSESGFKLTDAVITGIDLDIVEQYTTLKAYDGNAVLRVDSTSDLESLSLVVASVTVNENGSLESVSRDHGSESGFKLTDAVITGIDLDIVEQYTTLKAYDENKVLRVDSTSDLESLSLVVASVTVNANGSLESVSRDHGSESGFKLTDAVITGIDLDIVEQYTTLKAYDENKVLRVDSTSDLESLSLVVASVTVNANGSLESVSRDHGSESGFKLTDAVITGIDLDIVEQYTTLKAYDENKVLRVDSTSDLESLSLVVANVTVNANGSLESVSRDHGSESGFKLTDAVITGIDLDIIEQYTTLKAYDGNAVLRVDSTSDLESLSLVVASVTVNANGSLESVSRDHGSESGFKLTDAVITGIDLDIVEQYTTLKAYDENTVLRVDSTSDLESLSLVVASVTVNANGSLESVSRDHGSESGFKLTDAVITGIDLDIVEQYTTLKAYDGNAVLRVDSTSDLERLPDSGSPDLRYYLLLILHSHHKLSRSYIAL